MLAMKRSKLAKLAIAEGRTKRGTLAAAARTEIKKTGAPSDAHDENFSPNPS